MSILKCRLLYPGGDMFTLQATMNMKVNQVYPKYSLLLAPGLHVDQLQCLALAVVPVMLFPCLFLPGPLSIVPSHFQKF